MHIVSSILDDDAINAILCHLQRKGRDPRALPEHAAAPQTHAVLRAASPTPLTSRVNDHSAVSRVDPATYPPTAKATGYRS